ncbi:MAG: DUF4445 domain-containing protein, partial [Lachnospiraceae bacterium]|nr:DUF4445 domain-containing protein [Lachnospiraceae bacterium]
MRLTVKRGLQESTMEFHRDILLWDALAEMGYVLGRPCGGRGVCGRCEVIANGEPVRTCVTYLEEDMVIEELPLSEEMEVMTEGKAVVPSGDVTVKNGYGLAVDIGTTTIAAYLYKFPEGEPVRTSCCVNPQVRYGADIVTRMEYALNGGAGDLQSCLQKKIDELTGDFKIDKYVITGNTTMLHLLMGKSLKGMACAPYMPESLFGKWYGKRYLPPCISAFIGADITCAVLASGMLEKKTALLVDIGTNGEMVLYKDGKLICCSAAAGPAFEGAEISQGMCAERGAINRVYWEDNGTRYTTIGGAMPRGICGSGLVDAIAVMLEEGTLDDTVYLEEPYEIGDSKVFITPEDVRQLQLAKAAIRAGLETLLQEAGCSYEELECFYIAGGFGSYIDK